jgi:glycogen(starch) synthase
MGESKNMSPLKVLMTADTVGGVWNYSIELCNALSGYDVQFHLVTFGAEMQAWQKEEAGKLDHVTVYETEYRLEWMEDPWDDIEKSGAYLLSLQKVIQPDIVHLNGYVHGSLDWNVPVVMVAHSDVYSWWRAVKKEDPGAGWQTYFTKVKKGLGEANHVIAPSHAMMDELGKIYSLTKNYSVIYNARSEDLFYSIEKKKEVMCMGRVWDEAKNVKLLMDAADGVPYKIKIAGDNEFQRNYLDVKDNNVLNLGKLGSRQIAKELSSAGIYVLPAKYEPFGLSVLEAALSRCALVLGDIPSLREIWGDSAVYTDTDNADQLAQAINKLMSDEGALTIMAEKAYKQALKYNTKKMARQYMNVYMLLLHHQSQQAPKNSLT